MPIYDDYEDVVEEARRRREAGELSGKQFAEIYERALERAGFDNPQLAREVLQLRQTLSRETDRGCALTAAAYLDEMLVSLLSSYFVDDGKVVEQFFSASGPLSSFAAKIDLAYALGMMSPETRSSLHIVRRIRNDFAHVSAGISFRDEGISSRCLSLLSGGKLPARRRFMRAALSLVGAIYAAIQRSSHRDVGRDPAVSPEADARVRELRRAIEDETDTHFFKRALYEDDDDGAV